MSTQFELEDQLRVIICKIKCLSFFIETQDPDYLKPTDFDEIQQGLVLIFNGIVTELIEVKFDTNCIYNSPVGELVGPQNIISSYREHTEYAHSTFDKVIYESSVKELSPNEFEITYKDIISKMTKTHIYQCKQIVLFNSENLIEKITHEEISSEYENILKFYREVGLSTCTQLEVASF